MEDPNKWKDIPHSWIGRLDTVKTSIPLNKIYKLMSFKNFQNFFFFAEKENSILKFIWSLKTLNGHNNLEIEEQSCKSYNS